MEQPDSDEALMLRYRDGDAKAFELLYQRHKGPMYRYLLRQCGSRALAEELFQDVWTRLIQARSRYVVKAGFTTWLFRIAHNRLVDHYRRQAHGVVMTACAGPLPEPPVAASQEPENRVHGEQRLQRLLTLLEALPDEQREAFLLREEAGLSVAEIGRVTGTARETAKSRLRYAVQRLREGLREWV